MTTLHQSHPITQTTILSQLKDVLLDICTTPSSATIETRTADHLPTPAEGGTLVEISRWLGKTTLDVIGLAGFGYDFDSLHDPNNELAVALERMLSAGQVSVGRSSLRVLSCFRCDHPVC
jgi:hypothetical protein